MEPPLSIFRMHQDHKPEWVAEPRRPTAGSFPSPLNGERIPRKSSRIEPLNLIDAAAGGTSEIHRDIPTRRPLLSTRRLLLLGKAAIGIRRSRRPVRAERAGASESAAGVRSEATSIVGTKCSRSMERVKVRDGRFSNFEIQREAEHLPGASE